MLNILNVKMTYCERINMHLNLGQRCVRRVWAVSKLHTRPVEHKILFPFHIYPPPLPLPFPHPRLWHLFFSFLLTDIRVLKAHQCLFTKHHGCIFCILLIFFFLLLCFAKSVFCASRMMLFVTVCSFARVATKVFFLIIIKKNKKQGRLFVPWLMCPIIGVVCPLVFSVRLFPFPTFLPSQNFVVLDRTCLRWCVF